MRIVNHEGDRTVVELDAAEVATLRTEGNVMPRTFTAAKLSALLDAPTPGTVQLTRYFAPWVCSAPRGIAVRALLGAGVDPLAATLLRHAGFVGESTADGRRFHLIAADGPESVKRAAARAVRMFRACDVEFRLTDVAGCSHLR